MAEESYEDRLVLLEHKSAWTTMHYAAAELLNFNEAANLVCRENYRTDDFEQDDRLEKEDLTN